MKPVNIVHITHWYPNLVDPQLGIFIRKHIIHGHHFADNYVFAVVAVKSISSIEIVKNNFGNNVKEWVVQYPVKSGNKLANYRSFRKAIKRLYAVKSELNLNPDFVHCHVVEKSVAIASELFPKVPIGITEHWSGLVNGNFQLLSNREKNNRIKLYNRAKKIFVVNESLKESLVSLGVRTPIDLVGNIVEYSTVKQNKNECQKFLVVADLVDSIKNISGIIQAIKDVIIEKPDITLTIIGDGKDASLLKQKVNKLQLDDTVYFLGRKDNESVLEEIPNYDALIINSNVETFGVVALEALLSGVPVITKICGGPERFIKDGINGIIVDEELRLSEAIIIMIDSYKIYNSLKIHKGAMALDINNCTTEHYRKFFTKKGE